MTLRLHWTSSNKRVYKNDQWYTLKDKPKLGFSYDEIIYEEDSGTCMKIVNDATLTLNDRHRAKAHKFIENIEVEEVEEIVEINTEFSRFQLIESAIMDLYKIGDTGELHAKELATIRKVLVLLIRGGKVTESEQEFIDEFVKDTQTISDIVSKVDDATR